MPPQPPTPNAPERKFYGMGNLTINHINIPAPVIDRLRLPHNTRKAHRRSHRCNNPTVHRTPCACEYFDVHKCRALRQLPMPDQNPLNDLEAARVDEVSSITQKVYVSIRSVDVYPDGETEAETKARLKHAVWIQRDSYGSCSKNSG